jgi:hypothetical protein
MTTASDRSITTYRDELGATQIAVHGPSGHILVTRRDARGPFEILRAASTKSPALSTERAHALRRACALAGISGGREDLIDEFNQAHPPTVWDTHAGTVPHRHGVLPARNVTVVSGSDHCSECGGEIAYRGADDGLPGDYWHTGDPCTYFPIDPMPRCCYCGTDDPGHVTVRGALALADGESLILTACTRCGGTFAMPRR